MTVTDPDQIVDAVRERYASAAKVASTEGCCPPSSTNEVASDLYGADERSGLPAAAAAASLGCANPVALAALGPGETVLDLGSGGGIDVLLSARRVGPTGIAYGLDMTDEMLALAERNRIEAGAENVRFLRGRMEQIPLPANSVDVVLSNCVVNLSPDKDRVFCEAFRVLRHGGRLAIADIATLGPLPGSIRSSLDAWTACIAGSLSVEEIETKLATVGFEQVRVETLRTYDRLDFDLVASTALGPIGIEQVSEAGLTAAEDNLASVFIRARKPTASAQS